MKINLFLSYKERTKHNVIFSKILPNNQIITACRIELQVQETTMNEKLTMIGLKHMILIGIIKNEIRLIFMQVNFKELMKETSLKLKSLVLSRRVNITRIKIKFHIRR